MIDDEVALLDVLDTAGQEEYSAMREQYMRTGEGFLLVYSITSRTSFVEIATFQQQILRVKDKDYFPVIVVGNKCDLDMDRAVSQQGTSSSRPSFLLVLLTFVTEGRDLANHFSCRFIETSAKARINVDEAFYNLVREIRRYNKEQAGGSTSPGGGVVQNGPNGGPGSGRECQKNEDNNSGCCGSCVIL